MLIIIIIIIIIVVVVVVIITFNCLTGATPRFDHLKKFSLHFSSSSFVIRVNLLHP